MGWHYARWKFNCEHFANEVLYEHRTSKQADTVKALLTGAALIGLAALVVSATRAR